MDIDSLKRIVEGALLAAGHPLSLNQLNSLFPDGEQPGHGPLREALAALDAEMEGRAVELREVGSGYRLQIRSAIMPVISKLWTEKPPRYSRALLETLAIIAYRQPITRGEIEQIRGVSVSSNILRTLQERDWVRVIGHRDVPGRPELLGTTRAFLDYFNLKSLDELPTLAEIKDIDNLEPELELELSSPEIEPDSPQAEVGSHETITEEAITEEAHSEETPGEEKGSQAPVERKQADDRRAEEDPAGEAQDSSRPDRNEHHVERAAGEDEVASAQEDPGEETAQEDGPDAQRAPR